MSRWTEYELAQRLADNPDLRLGRPQNSPSELGGYQTRQKQPKRPEQPRGSKAAYAMSEADLLKSVLELANMRGWLCAHFRPAKTSKGWRTAVSGDGVGFPDLVLVRRDRCLFVELKSERGKVTDAQATWLGFLTGANQIGRVFIFRPSDWLSGKIEEILQ